MMDVFDAMRERHSTRAFSTKPVQRRVIEEIIFAAGLAPSAINLQPWEYIVTYGEEKDRLVRRLQKVHAERRVQCGPGTEKPLPNRFAHRSKQAVEAMEPQIARLGLNFNQFIEEGSCSFYGAPVAIIVTIDRVFPQIRYLDVGLSVSYLLLAAHAKGLATCPIGLITAYSEDIREILDIPDEKQILLAVALGYADKESPANAFTTHREPLEEILTWYE